MFAQYNQQAGGTAVSTVGMVWNGVAWVTAGPTASTVNPTTTTYSTGAYAPHQAGGFVAEPAMTEDPATLITKYTQYYHDWTARAQEHEAYLQQLPMHSQQERAEAQRNVEWSRYYADQSSRAAHHFHSNPNQAAPFQLPPAPPAKGAAATTAAAVATTSNNHIGSQQQPSPSKTTSRWSAGQQPQPQPAQQQGAGSDGTPPNSLKSYAHRCLAQCRTEEQKKTVERETEQVIARALQSGTLHTTNWDNVPLIAIPGMSSNSSVGSSPIIPSHIAAAGKRNYYQSPTHAGITAAAPQYAPQQQQHHSNSKKPKFSHPYGPTSSGEGGSPSAPSFSHPNNSNANKSGHYGPASSTTSDLTTNPTSPSQNFSHYQSPQQQKKASKKSKYSNDNLDFIPVPTYGSKHKVNSMKYVNPNSKKGKTDISKNTGMKSDGMTLAKRANRFSGPGGVNETGKKYVTEDKYLGKGVIGGSKKALDENDYEHMKVKGTCQKLEKQYLRLTAPPRPELVRPLNILKQHLTNLKQEWKRPEKKRRDYLWFCAEMKAMRQDLTVQHISNAFTVDVYETHARMALQENDVNEFNQAQTQLKILYDKLDDKEALKNENEFVAYRMIYFVMMTLNKKYNGGSSDLLKLMLSLTPAQREDSSIEHALQIREAVSDMDYFKFFQLHKSCPNWGDKLTGLMVPTIQYRTLQIICTAYRPVAEVAHTLKQLGFPVSTNKQLKEGKKFLESCGCILNGDGTEIKTKESVVRESDLQEKTSLI